MKEYFIHITNCPIDAESPMEAAKIFHDLYMKESKGIFVYEVTDNVGILCHEESVKVFGNVEKLIYDPNAFGIKEEFDSGDWNEWTWFQPYEPLPVDEEGNPYFPPNEGILVANIEVRQPNEKRLQFIDEEKKEDEIQTPDNLG